MSSFVVVIGFLLISTLSLTAPPKRNVSGDSQLSC